MKLNRNVTGKINWILDNICPPIIRDCRSFMRFLISLAVGKNNADTFLNFKQDLGENFKVDLVEAYEKTAPVYERETDLNDACVKHILDYIVKNTPPPPVQNQQFLQTKKSRFWIFLVGGVI